MWDAAKEVMPPFFKACVALALAIIFLMPVPVRASYHPGSPVLCTVDASEHMVMPALIVNRDAIVRSAEDLNFVQRWWYGVDALARIPLPPVEALVVANTYAAGHGELHAQLRPLGRLALATGWADPARGGVDVHIHKAYGASMASPRYAAGLLALLMAFVLLGKLMAPAGRRRRRQMAMA